MVNKNNIVGQLEVSCAFKLHVGEEMDDKRLLCSVAFSNIVVNEVDESGGIFVGENIQCNWSSHSKQNYGLGIVYGIRNEMYSPINVVMDPDVIDHPIKQGIIP